MNNINRASVGDDSLVQDYHMFRDSQHNLSSYDNRSLRGGQAMEA